MKTHPFSSFLETFVPQIEKKFKELNLAGWILETTGSQDAADLRALLDTEFKFLFHDPAVYQQLLKWDQNPPSDPLLKRQLNILIRGFKQNQIPESLLEKIAQEEANLAQTYANFRPTLDGKPLSENDIREILKNEKNPRVRQKVWEASKEIGTVLAPQILSLVALRNQAAKSLGYSDFFEMQLDLQEVDRDQLVKTFNTLAQKSNDAYERMLHQIEGTLQKRFPKTPLGPWAWSDPFCQEDPLDVERLDQLVSDVDIPAVSRDFYQKMGFNVQPILDRSDLYERPGKNQHAFCTNIDRKNDIRTLNNVKSSIKWLDTVLHELGHGVYELCFDESLPWLLREPPHMIPTEAMALFMGRQAYSNHSLPHLVGEKPRELLQTAQESLKRHQLIFSRWVLVMTAFEKELYKNPTQDLNRLWWQLVEKYQMILAPKGREGKADWAAKYHIGLAPVYYFSYLLGELFASTLHRLIEQKGHLPHAAAGEFLRKKLFAPGDRWPWSELIEQVTGQPLAPDDWLQEFAR